MPRKVIIFDEDEKDMFKLLIDSSHREKERLHERHDEYRERQLDNAVIFVQSLVKDGIEIEPWHA